MLRDPLLAEQHRIVVVHVNYHQPKTGKMAAAYDYYVKGSTDAVQRELRGEPT